MNLEERLTAVLERLPISRETQGKIIRFGVVGAGATCVHAIVFLVLTDVIGVAPTPATVPAFLTAFAFSYLLNHSWTFRLAGRHGRYVFRYGVTAVTGVLLNMGLMYMSTSVLGWGHHVGLVIVVVVVPLFSLLSNMLWGFR